MKPLVLKIEKVEYVGAFILNVFFSDGKMQEIDFGPFLKSSLHPDVKKYALRKNFLKFIVEDGELMWGDFDLIFPIMDLYKNAIGSRASQLRERADTKPVLLKKWGG